MKQQHIRIRQRLLARGTWPAVVAIAAAAGIAGGGMATAQGASKALKPPELEQGRLTVDGGAGRDAIELNLRAGQPGILEVDENGDGTADFSFDRAGITSIVIKGGSGDDSLRIDESGGVFTDTIPTTFDGGSGDDTMIGGSGAETFLGGSGDDFVDGNRGNDAAFLGSGADTFRWDPGDGSDTIEGQSGRDTMLFNGANVAEKVDLSANGGRLRFTRDVAGITMDTDGVEQVDFNALGGADTVTVNDLAATDVDRVNVDLAAAGGGGDGAVDKVVANGTPGNDAVDVQDDGSGGTVVTGLAATIDVLHPESTDQVVVDGLAGSNSVDVNGTDGPDRLGLGGDATGVLVTGLPATVSVPTTASDRVSVDGLGGNDRIDGSAQQAQPAALTLDGGGGDDGILGTQGVETTIGGDGNDFADGNRGNDTAFMGAGDDTFQWDPGDGSDTIEGDAGTDTMLFNGANIAEKIDLSANGGRLRFTRDVANIVMDTDNVERVIFNALGGADLVTVNDLAATDVDRVDVNLAASGGGDGAADQVTVNGTAGNDVVEVTGGAGSATVGGLAALVNVTGGEAANDRLLVKALAGDDVVDATGVAAGAIALTLDGAEGNDILLGGAGDDTLVGGPGDDVLHGGPGLDVLDGGPGSNVLLQD